MDDPVATVGVFDSGVGGLSVLRELHRMLPCDLVYVADSNFVPYGAKSPEFIRERSSSIAHFLVEKLHSSAVVVACNTATTHAVDMLRHDFPAVPIVGMEPAIKPAASATRTGVVGILATAATLAGERVTNLIERSADGIAVVTQPCPGLVEQVEHGDLSGPHTVDLIERFTEPILARGADVIVLGCTHYNFLRHTITRVVGPSITLIDSAGAVARRTAIVLAARPGQAAAANTPGRDPKLAFLTSGDPQRVGRVIDQLWGEPTVVQPLMI